MSSLFYLLIIWLFMWFFGWAGWYLIPKNKRDYIKNYLIVSFYFLIVSLIMIYIFRDSLDSLVKNLSFFPIIIVLVFSLINFLAFFLTNKYILKPIEFIEKYSKVHFLHMDYRYLLSKSFEIFFQQILIISLVFILNTNGFNIFWITFIFMCLFGFAHIPMLKIGEGLFGLLILIASIFSSFLFPYLILNFEYGYVYTFILHWLFYTNTGILFWIIKSRQLKKVRNIADNKIQEVHEIASDKIQEVKDIISDQIKK